MKELTAEQKTYIVQEYGASIEIIERIERILSDIKFEVDFYTELIIEIVSEYETNELKKELESTKLFNNLREIIEHVLRFKLKSIDKNQKKYRLINHALNNIKTIKHI